MASETLTIPGTMKTIRATRDLEYRGKTIVGRRKVRVDGKHGAYEETLTPGETAIVDQYFAKEAVMSGKAELLEGGFCEVIAESDGFHRYTDWRVKDGEAAVYERVEYLKPGGMGGGPYWQAGFKCRVDISQLNRSDFCYEDEEPTQWSAFRVLKPSPKKVRMSQAEQQGKINAIYSKLFPSATA